MRRLFSLFCIFISLISSATCFALNAPSNLSPGTTTSPGPLLTSSQQTLSWSQPSGAASYLVNVRDTNTATVVNYLVNSGTITSTQLTLVQGHAYKWNMWAYSGANNTGTQSPLSVSNYFRIGQPDLLVTGSPYPSTTTPTAGNQITIYYTVANQGNGDSLACSNRIQIKPHGSISVLTENRFPMGSILAHGSTGLTAQLTIPSSATAGYYDLYIIVDNTSVNIQTNTDNDVFSSYYALYIYAATPNLAPYTPFGWSGPLVLTKSPTGTTGDATFSDTDTVYAAWGCINNGTAATAQAFRNGFYIDDVFQTDTLVSISLPPTSATSGTGVSLGQLSAGTHKIRLTIDWAGAITESSETDNTYTNTITVSSFLATPSGLTLSNASNGVNLSWQDNSSNESGFRIQRRQNLTYTYFSVGPNQTNYADTGVSQSIQYCYAVAATNSGGSSAFTPEQCDTYTLPGSAPIAVIAGYLTPVIGTTTYYGIYSTGTGLKYSWTTSNGQQSTAQNPQFAFYWPGIYTIYMTVTDSSSRPSSASISINVQPSNAGTSIGVALGADPVVLSTGNYVQNHVDLQMPGIGFPFEFRRFYNSKFSDQPGQPLGFGWTFNYNERIQDTGTNTLFVRGDGSTWTFYPTNSGYIGEPGNFDSLVHNTNTDNSWTLTDKSQTVTLFGSNGCLVSITDKNGNALNCTYVAGVLNQIEDTAGRFVSFTTNSYGCIASMSDPLNRTVRYLYNSNTNLMAVVDMNGNTNFYNYNASHQMTNAIDGRGVCYIQNVYDPTNFAVTRQCDAFTNWTFVTYDFTDRITYVTNALDKLSVHYFDNNLLETNVIDEAGNQQSFAYDLNRNRTFIQDKNGNQTHYTYDALGNVTNKNDAFSNFTSIAYNSLNNPTIRVDALTNITTFGYDSRGNLTSTTNALNLVSRVQYDTSGLPTVLMDAREFGTTNQYDSRGNLTNLIDAHGFATQFVYDGVGRKSYQIDALNHTTSFAYDNNDNLLYTTNALNFVNAFTYDANNNRTSSRNPRNAITTNIFDLKDRLIAVLAPLNQTNGTIYDALDRKVATFDALGNQTGYTYDDVGNLTAVTNALNQVTRFTYDPQGNQTSVIDPTAHYVTNFFDVLNRKTVTIDVSISTNSTVYDALGHVSATTNANNQVTHFFYDSIGRLTNVVDSANQSVFFAYDQNGNRVLTTDPNGHSWTNIFDELNRLVEKDDPDANKTFFHYDPVGNLTNKVTANGDSINYGYDVLNRLTNIAYPSGQPVTFAYDSVGNRTNMTDNLSTTTWQFDLLDRLTSVTDPYGQTIANGFDANGNRVSLTYPGSKVVNYGFDALNRMTALTNWLNGVVSYGYDSRGNLIAVSNANGTTAAYAYDVADRLVGLTNAAPDASVIAAYTVTLDGVGNHTQVTHNQPLFPILSNQTNNYSYDSDNRLATIDGQTVTHNANGDLTAFGTNSYTYDFEDRLVQLSLTNTFTCDGLGNRLALTVSGQARRFVLDRTGALTQVLAETDTNNAPVAYYVYGLGLAEQISSSGTVATYHFNIQGSTVALTDSGGKVSDSYAYDSFGVLANSDGDSPQPFRYLGKFGILDDGTGLYYARARYFSPQLGHFLTKDTVASKDNDSQSLNRFVYALNNPLRFRDESGLVAAEGSIWSTLNLSLRNLIVPEQAQVLLSSRTANSTLPYYLSPSQMQTGPTLFISQAPTLTPEEQLRSVALVNGYEQVSAFLGHGLDTIGLAGVAALPEVGAMAAAVTKVTADQSNWGTTRDQIAETLAGSLLKTENGRQFLRDVGDGKVLAIRIGNVANNVEEALTSYGISPELIGLILDGQ